MTRLLRSLSAAGFCLATMLGAPTALGQLKLPIEFDHTRTDASGTNETWINYRSLAGVPISRVPGNPGGSNGQQPADNESTPGVEAMPTPGQFRGNFVLGGTPGLSQADWVAVSDSSVLRSGAEPFSGQVAAEMRLPRVTVDGRVILVLRRANVGAAYLNRRVSLSFGAVIPPPEKDYLGSLLRDTPNSAYWLPEPYYQPSPFYTNNHAGARYYWSSHARQVYAVQSGPVQVTWRMAQPFRAGETPNYVNPNGPVSFQTNGPNIFLLYTENYLVSGSPVKPPRKIHWNQRGFRTTGVPVHVPAARVGAVNIVYSDSFPRTVSEEYVGVGDTSPTDGTDKETLPELRTLWYDEQQRSIFAYNTEGRVFVELLGDRRPDGETHQSLGFEIVDVTKQSLPSDVTIELGERIVPPNGGSLEQLFPEPLDQAFSISFAFRHDVAGSGKPAFYATRETFNDNDYLVHWLEEGEQGLKWPKALGRYRLVWPTDMSRFSHYIRPPTATESEAALTAIRLDPENSPTIEYQDWPDQPRAKFTPDLKFYTWLNNVPVHRTLLRYSSGDNIAFERVLSVLNTEIRQTVAFADESLDLAIGLEQAKAQSVLQLGGAAGTYGQLPDDTYFAPGAFTIEARVYARELPNGSRLIDFGNGPTANNVILALADDDTGRPALLVYRGSSRVGTLIGSSALPLNRWFHIAATFDGTVAGLYINGVLDAQGSFQSPNSVQRRFAYVGRTHEATGVFTHADIDNLRIWSTRRTQAEIRDGLNAVFPSRTPGLIAQFTFSQLANPASDSSGNEAHMTLHGAAATGVPDLNLMDSTRFVRQTVAVGQRIEAPPGEAGSSGESTYLAGYIVTSEGTSYNPHAYLNPFEAGFEAANRGAIIPVNSIPGGNQLEVWWFRSNRPSAGFNAGNTLLGFKPVFWPSVIGRYLIEWPSNPREIVLASNNGSGTLDPLQAPGSIYFQNDPEAHGYNPNEEHAIMSGGTAYATRDDLNRTQAGPGYSSHPFVLLQYEAEDGRPAMLPFKVLREKPEDGLVFDYAVPAGRVLQPPAPLDFLADPVEGSGDTAVNYNTEPTGGDGDLPAGWDNKPVDGKYDHYKAFTYRDRNHDFWVYRGPHAGLPALQVGTYEAERNSFTDIGSAQAVVNQPFEFTVHASRQAEYLTMVVQGGPAWLNHENFKLFGTPTNTHGPVSVSVIIQDLHDGTRRTNRFTLRTVANGVATTQGPPSILSTNEHTGTIVEFTNRPPFLARSPSPSNSFTMRYYYKTEPGFAWPGIADPPEPGSIVPYLRRWNAERDRYEGEPHLKETPSLSIVYRPYWPEDVREMRYGQTLTEPSEGGLPGVRDFKTAHILYQQSIAANLTQANSSAILHDPTRAKYADIATRFPNGQLPPGVRTESFGGRTYFPDLPPHLISRLFVEPERGTHGSLTLVGEHRNESVGGSFLLLNVLRDSDREVLEKLCPTTDVANFQRWVALVNDLATLVVTHVEKPGVPGVYEEGPSRKVELGDLAEVTNDNTAVDSYALSATGPGSGYVTLLEASGTAFTLPGEPVAMHIIKVGGELDPGRIDVLYSPNPLSELVTFQHTPDLAGRYAEYEYEWRIAGTVDGLAPPENQYLRLDPSGLNVPRQTIGGAGLQALGDNFVRVRYRSKNSAHPLHDQWSAWTAPALAEGWIKRVLRGINPFTQRLTNLFNNQVSTDVSLLTQAGKRWEGDVALNIDTINNYGLIEIYETVLRRGRMLSIDAGYNYGPANDALLLAAGYLNDLYMLLGNEAWADAANPTIGIGTADNTYGEIATALFSFRGQVPSLLEEELALLRGRDDFLLPGVEISPFYNRLVWNYTRGIDAGEVVYALNYNIQEKPDTEPDGVIDAADAARLFPQGHGDAYGHYLTALKSYYSLLISSYFDWVPRIEAVNVLGAPVSVDYQDERKFAAAAAAVARSGRQLFDLTWRRDYLPVRSSGWENFAQSRMNPSRQYETPQGPRSTERFWGMDHWASRVGQGAWVNWLFANAILPHEDPVPGHEGIQKVDRTTVPELAELATIATGLQQAMDNAESGQSPVGIPEGGLVFDLNPNKVVGVDGGTHFEQIYQRAKTALNNAVVAFDDAKDVTRLMRSEEDSLADFQAAQARQEQAYNVALIDLYGTPYPEDIGPGKLYLQGYEGPDTRHYHYVDLPEAVFPEMWTYSNTTEWEIPLRDLPGDWVDKHYTSADFPVVATITFNIGPHGYAEKPAHWTGRRRSPGRIQQAISEQIMAHMRLRQTINDTAGDLVVFQKAIDLFKADKDTFETIRNAKTGLLAAEELLEKVKFSNDLFEKIQDSIQQKIIRSGEAVLQGFPMSVIGGTATGGDLSFSGRAALAAAGLTLSTQVDVLKILRYTAVLGLETVTSSARRWTEFEFIGGLEREKELRTAIAELGNKLDGMQSRLWTLNERLREYDDKQRAVQMLEAEGETIQAERRIFRTRAAAIIHGYRTRDAAFRIFRNEKLERYKTLFDLAARYTLLAANAYDYETGLLGTSAGQAFKSRIISSRALGVTANGEPQFAGSNTGDPGLSSALAELKADWDVARDRLGFNRPDAYATTASLRTEKARIRPDAEGDSAWRDLLHSARRDNLLEDTDVRRFCMQIDPGNGLPVPGLIFTFSTTIAEGLNVFGLPLASGDHAFHPSSFATRIGGVGVAFEGYRGMGDPSANASAVEAAQAISQTDSVSWFLDPDGLSATPYVYLIPVGVDSMRTPPLGDAQSVRSWGVEDLALPMPFNLGNSDFQTLKPYHAAGSLAEPLFAIRKHHAFRPVSDPAKFELVFYSDSLPRSEYINNRLIGRSVWNSQWKLVIPGRALLSNPDEGINRFIRTVSDIKIHFVTYSYAGN